MSVILQYCSIQTYFVEELCSASQQSSLFRCFFVSLDSSDLNSAEKITKADSEGIFSCAEGLRETRPSILIFKGIQGALNGIF